MEREIAAAVKWWRECLEGPASQDNGDRKQTSIMTTLAAMKYERPSLDQLCAFEVALAQILRDDFKDRWYTDDPIRGCGIRCILNDYGADLRLENACKMAGIRCTRFTFPCKTRMGIDPGCVKVAVGYGAGDEIIYQQPKEPASE